MGEHFFKGEQQDYLIGKGKFELRNQKRGKFSRVI